MINEKIYSVEFMNYTNSLKDTVSDYSDNKDLSKTNYIHNEHSDLFLQTLVSDPEHIYRMNELFNSAEYWLNCQGIKTRTEYGNLLPTYNLFLEIGEWLEKRLTLDNDE